VGMPQRMRELGVKQESLPGFVPGAMSGVRLMSNNPRVLTADDVLKIFQNAW
jgi:alcohol dehydrogenase class IV